MNSSARESLSFRATILGLGALVVSAAALAGVGKWSSNGPEQTYVSALVIDPSAPGTLYAGTQGGVFKSIDGGGSWSGMNTGLTVHDVVALAIDPKTPTTLYAGTFDYFCEDDDSCFFKSTDGGNSWSPIHIQSPNPYPSTVTIDPVTPTTLYVGTSFGVFKSIDGGGSWTKTSALGEGFNSINALVIDPSAPATLYAGLSPLNGNEGGVFKSTDGGGSWSAMNAGLPNVGVRALAIDPSAPGTLYAGTEGGVYKSNDAGGSWTAMNAGLTPGLIQNFVRVLAIDPSAPGTLYAGTEGGVFKSSNGAGSWAAMNAGLTNTHVHDLAIDPATPTTLYAGTGGGGVFDYHQGVPGPCAQDSTTLCLNDGHFQVQTQWTTRDGSSGFGQAVVLTGDAGYFTFFDPANVEVMVKVLNGCSVNGSFWTFAGGLTNVGVVMTVTDSQTGTVNTYTNPQGTAFQPIQDNNAFASCALDSQEGTLEPTAYAEAPLAPPIVSESFDASAAPCVADATTLCLNDSRYKVQAQWFAQDGRSGAGQVLPLTEDTGAFWFLSPSNVEAVIKVLNGCGVNTRYWVFAGGLTNLDVTLTVTDTQTGAIKTYTNAQGTPFPPIQDTAAFASCP